MSRIDETVLSLYARGLTTGDIAAHFAEIFDAQVSKDTISRITDRVAKEMQAWTSRPLERVYAAVVVDAINVKVRDGQVANRPVYAAIGVDLEGHKGILGMWISGGGESAKFWMVVLTELRNHGVAVFFLVCDGLKGLPDSVNAVWFATIVQTCLIHLIRNSFRFASRKYWDGLSRDLNRAQRYWLRPRRRRPVTREEGCAMPRKQRLTWTVVLWLAVVVTGCAEPCRSRWRHRAVAGRG